MPVLERIREELLDYRGTGMSVMEMSHRSPEFEAINAGAEAGMRRLLGSRTITRSFSSRGAGACSSPWCR